MMDMTGRALSGRRIIVLGGTGGLGRSVTHRLRTDGASVLVADARLPADADREADLDYITVDALDEASVAAALAKSPPAAAVVNLIGGYTPPQPLSGLDISVLRQQREPERVHDGVRFRRSHGHSIGAGRRQRLLHNLRQRRRCHHGTQRRRGRREWRRWRGWREWRGWRRHWSAPPPSRLGILMG